MKNNQKSPRPYRTNLKPTMSSAFSNTGSPVGDHGLRFYDIFCLVDGIFRGKFTHRVVNEEAAKILKMALNIGIKDSMFTQVSFGDLRVLICDDYLGAANAERVVDIAIVNNQATIFIFSDPLTNEKYRRDDRVYRLFNLFSVLIEIYSIQEFMNVPGSIYAKIVEYAPVVMTVRIMDTIYDRFVIGKDWNHAYYPDNYAWFDEGALELIRKIPDRGLLEYGALVSYVDSYYNDL